MPPEYFMHACTVREAVLYVEGMHKRQHSLWAQARYIGYYSAAPHCKNFKFENMGQFPWEKESKEPVDVERQIQELKELREQAQNLDAGILKKINHGQRNNDSEAPAEQ